MYGPFGKRNTGRLVKRWSEQRFNQYGVEETTEPNPCQVPVNDIMNKMTCQS
jgi:hypothetical protein